MEIINGYFELSVSDKNTYIRIVNTLESEPGVSWIEKYPYSDRELLRMYYEEERDLYYLWIEYSGEGFYDRDKLMMILGAHYSVMNSKRLMTFTINN